jgi:hypothetical protein
VNPVARTGEALAARLALDEKPSAAVGAVVSDGFSSSASGTQTPISPGALAFTCEICLLTFEEPWCSSCGQGISAGVLG